MINLAVIQARMGSTRLQNKMLLSLHGKPIIEWVVKRIQQSKKIDHIIVAIPDTKKDEILRRYIQKLNIEVFVGSEENVLERFYFAANKYKPKNIVRICADNPLVSPQAIDELIGFFQNNICDYAYNHIPKNNLWPDGLGAEITTFENLKKMYNEVTQAKHKEHCMSYIVDNPHLFSIKTFDPKEKLLHFPNLKFDVDTFEDFTYLSNKNFNISINDTDLIKLFKEENENT